MQTKYGLQVDAWGALLMERAPLRDALEAKVIENMKARGLQNFEAFRETVSLDSFGAREHVIFEQRLGGGGAATAALRIFPNNQKDLEISWRLFEKNTVKGVGQGLGQTTLIVLGIGFILVGIPLSLFGVGLLGVCIGIGLIGMGLGWWGTSRNKTTASAFQQFDSRALAQTLDYALMRALSELGVTTQELRILRQSSAAGMGNLKPTNPLDGLDPSKLI